MVELFFLALSVLVDVYNTVDWSRASDFMSFLNETLTFVVGISSQRTSKEKDDQESRKL